MRAFKITQEYITVLLFIQQGMIQEQIAKNMSESPSTTSYRVKMLIREGYLLVQFRDAFKVFALTPKALTLLSHTGTPQTHQTSNQEPISKPKSSTLPPKRLNGARLYFRPFRTEYGKLESKFKQAGIAYEQHQVRNYIQYEVAWKGYKVKFTTQKLIAYCPEQFSGFGIDGKALTNSAIDKALPIINALIQALDLRMQAKDGLLWFRLAYFEIAHTSSEAARNIQKATRKSYVPLAFDLKTGQITAWADNSYNLHEAEFNRHNIEAKMANMVQDMQDDRWLPRVEQLKLNKVADIVLSQEERYSRQFELVDRLTKQVEIHLDLMQKIDRRLSQKSLKDWC